MNNVAIGYCHRPQVPHILVENLLRVAKDGQIDTIIYQECFFIANGRNCVVEDFLKTDKEWLLFIDDDVWFYPRQIKELLLAAHKDTKPIVGGLYFTEMLTGIITPTWMKKYPEAQYRCLDQDELKGPSDLVDVDVLGMGFTLIHRKVFEAFPVREDNWRWFGHDVVNGVHTGEDNTFCARAKELGFPIYGYRNVQLPHKKLRYIMTRDYVNQPAPI